MGLGRKSMESWSCYTMNLREARSFWIKKVELELFLVDLELLELS